MAFNIGDFVSKKTGSKWRGHVVTVGTYGTALHGVVGGLAAARPQECWYAVESWFETGSVQTCPESELEPWKPPSAHDAAGREATAEARVELIARVMCAVDGHDPEGLAMLSPEPERMPRGFFLTGAPFKAWRLYAAYALALVDRGLA